MLTDSYDSEYFRYAVLSENITIDEQLNKLGIFTVSFSCLPFKYSFSGQVSLNTSAKSLTLTNPESFNAKPLICVTATGSFTLTATGTNHTSKLAYTDSSTTSKKIFIDSDKMCVYSDAKLLNDSCTFTGGFPVLTPGTNTVALSGNVTQLSVIPKWRTL